MAATIFSGNTIKALKRALQLFDQSTIYSGNIDPSSVSTSGNAGDVYISTSTFNLYVKQDNGSSTNWSKSSTLVTFTPGSVPFANGAGNLTQDNVDFFWDATDKRLGIGTNTPSQTLHVVGNGLFTGNVNISSLTASELVATDGSKNLISQALGNLTDVGTDGIIITGGSGSVIGSGTSISQQVADTTHNGYLASTDWNTFNNKQPAGNYITALTGDVTATGPGSVASSVAKIQGTTVSGTTGTVNVAFSASPTFTGTINAASVSLSSTLNMNSNLINNVTDPVAAQDAATKSYVDSGLAALNPKTSVQAATTASSDTSSYTYNNGSSGVGATLTGPVNTALTVDGFTFTIIGQRILVKNDTQSPSGAFNGIYSVTQLQTVSLPVILTRTSDYNTAADMNSAGLIPVINGTVNSLTSWNQIATITTVGTDPLTFSEFTANPSLYLLKANNLNDVASASTSFNNISPITSTGDIIIGNGTNSNTRLSKGTQYQTLQATSTTVAYDALHLDQAVAVTGILPNSNTTATNNNTNSTIVARDGSGNFAAGTITAALTGIASGNLLKSTGDIDQTSFSAANNQSVAANVTGLSFSNASVRSFDAQVSVYVSATSSLYEVFKLYGIQRGSDWMMSQTSTGDTSGFIFSITTSGQIQYVNNNYSGFSSATLKFRAQTLSV